ncbi:MAG: alpha/beta hydrolase [Proteobacteria bacterium]|nr:MAG: alpha/beta hydrolase [Pseudomonadota bacterium]
MGLPLEQTYLHFEHENPEAPVLVLIHGGPGLSYHYFEPLIEQLKANVSILTYDQGTQSSVTDFPSAVSELHYVISNASLGSREIVLVGHSFGSLLAFAYVEKYHRSYSLILVSWIYDTKWASVFSDRTPEAKDLEANLKIQNESSDDPKQHLKNLMHAYARYYFPLKSFQTASACFEKMNYYPELLESVSANWASHLDAKAVVAAYSGPILSIIGNEDRVVLPEYTSAARKLNSKIEDRRSDHRKRSAFSIHRPAIESSRRNSIVFRRALIGKTRLLKCRE